MPQSVAARLARAQTHRTCRGGLTSRQAWTLAHIVRCTCGAWVLVTDRELADETAAEPVVCRHFRVGA